ncbi:MAG: alpha/beta hydrolase [Candidatus Coproplasma sp.]
MDWLKFMEWYEIALICLGCVFVLFVLFASAICVALNGIVFSRQDKNPDFKYFTPEDFKLNAEDLTVTYSGINLYSKIYTVKPVEECEKVVIFQHGFGAGSSSYMTEIARYAKLGYAVVATDAYGCNNSQGKGVKGFYVGTETVIATYIGVKKDNRLKDKKIVLMGHSWGAYSVLCASNKIKVDGVVALSGFNAPAQCLCDQIKLVASTGKLLAPLLHPFFFILNAFRSTNGNAHSAKRIVQSGVKALIIHGAKDKTVPYKHSSANKANGGNVTKLILEDKRHNPYNTAEAEDKLKELSGGKKFATEEESKEYFANFDWDKATEEDESVMAKIDEFVKNI